MPLNNDYRLLFQTSIQAWAEHQLNLVDLSFYDLSTLLKYVTWVTRIVLRSLFRLKSSISSQAEHVFYLANEQA